MYNEHASNCVDLTSAEKMVYRDTSDDLTDGNYEIQVYAWCGGHDINSPVWGGSVDFTDPSLLEGFTEPRIGTGFDLTSTA